MAIEFDCPHCGHHYRLKDELAGKAAACKNCRKKITIPQPVTIPDDTPLPAPPEDVEAAALAALSDVPQAKEDEAAKIIPVECNYCGHKWTEPISRAGKNTLCPNPECKQRVKIPEPKDEGQYDWRQARSKLPSLAAKNQEKLEGVQDAADVKQLSTKTLQEKVIEVEYEPRPLKQKVMFVLLAVGLLAGMVFGVMYLTRSRTEGKEDRVMKEAQEEFAKYTDSLPKTDPQPEVPVFTAVMHMAAGEYALRHNTKEKLREAMEQFAKALSVLRQGSSPARNAAVAELAVAILELGGTEEQAREQLRIRWTREISTSMRPNEHLFTVHEELTKILGLASGTDLDFRKYLARRLTRELVKRGQTSMADQLLPPALFQNELTEGQAIVALEIHRADKSSAIPQNVAQKLVAAKSHGPSAYTLLMLLKPSKAPTVPPPSGNGPVSDTARYAYTGFYLLDNKPDDALALARRPGKLEDQLRALALCAEWSANSGPALDAAASLAIANKDRKDANLSPYALLRLAQLAGVGGKAEQAKQFANAMPDESAKAWAAADALRHRLAAAPETRGEDSWSVLPDDPKAFRAGHAWGRLCLARHNTRISGKRSDEVKAVSAWPTPISAFGKAGVALGLQDRDK